MNSYPVSPPHARMHTAPACSIQLSFPSPRSGTGEVGGKTWLALWFVFCVVKADLILSVAVWAGVPAPLQGGQQRSRQALPWEAQVDEVLSWAYSLFVWRSACPPVTSAVMLIVFFSCFLQTSSLSLRHEIALESFVSFGKIKTFKYAWICAGNLSG